jgi:TetR/AcrR family transcriptional regulator, transcriptional repressor for nem operon
MRVSRERAAENRDRIVDVAGRLFRERGFDGIGVANLMKAAGLTHGGFYGHFASRRTWRFRPAHALSHSRPRPGGRWRPKIQRCRSRAFWMTI